MRARVEADLPTQFIGYVILITVYNGNVDAWIKWLREKGSTDQLISDFPFAVWVKEEAERDPDLMRRIRKMVEEQVLAPK